MIPPVRVLHGGVRNEEVVRIFTRNSRFPDMLEGDLNSLMAACNLGCKRLEECAALHGVDALENAFEAIISQTETALQQQISAHIPEGSWAFRDRIDFRCRLRPRLLRRCCDAPEKRQTQSRFLGHRPPG